MSKNCIRDEDLAQCVSMAGWIRGTAALTALIDSDYDPDRAELLNQPFLVEHFSGKIKEMPKSVQNHENIKSVAAGLEAIQKQMEAGDTPSPLVVKEVNEICERLVREFAEGKR